MAEKLMRGSVNVVGGLQFNRFNEPALPDFGEHFQSGYHADVTYYDHIAVTQRRQARGRRSRVRHLA